MIAQSPIVAFWNAVLLIACLAFSAGASAHTQSDLRTEIVAVQAAREAPESEVFSGGIDRIGAVEEGNPELFQASARRQQFGLRCPFSRCLTHGCTILEEFAADFCRRAF